MCEVTLTSLYVYCVELQIIYYTSISIMLQTYKYASRSTRENVADLIYVAKPSTHVLLRATFTHYTSMYYVIYVAVTYTLLYTYTCVIYASYDICMYYKFKVSTRDCKMCTYSLYTSFLELHV
ncbi:hypothetical protein ACS0PU_002879 [Formica fusca]